MAIAKTTVTAKANGEGAIAGVADKSLTALGKEKYLKGCETALDTIRAFWKAENEISKIRGGLGAVLMNLATECVKLSMKGAKANLPLAAQLMKDACAQAEQTVIAEDAKTQPKEIERPIRDIVPSWPTMRTDAIKALENKVNPVKFDNFTQVRATYKKLLEANATTDKSNKGRKRGAKETGTHGIKTNAAAAKVLKEAGVRTGAEDESDSGVGRGGDVSKLSDKAKAASADLIRAIAKVPKTLQDMEVLNWISGLTAKIEDYAKEIKAHRGSRPAAEGARASAAS